MAVFSFSMFLGGALQLTNMYGDILFLNLQNSGVCSFNKQHETVFLPKFHSINDVLKN
jgi:hypothetical protein